VPADRAPRGRWILHFTHSDNLPEMVAAGRLSCDARARLRLTRVAIGDAEIKKMRRERPVGAGPGGCVGDYVPFYFGPRSPMIYRIAKEHEAGRIDWLNTTGCRRNRRQPCLRAGRRPVHQAGRSGTSGEAARSARVSIGPTRASGRPRR
jgi:hypothetical protein